MTTATVTVPTFNRTHVGRALRDLRLAYRDDDRRRNALNRAALDLEAQRWQWSNGTLVIESVTEIGKQVKYTVTADGCPCPAGIALKPCRHKAAWELLFAAEQIAKPAKVRQTFEELQAEVDSWF
jgi:hypothetical protein